jgi:hypothetical protein
MDELLCWSGPTPAQGKLRVKMSQESVLEHVRSQLDPVSPLESNMPYFTALTHHAQLALSKCLADPAKESIHFEAVNRFSSSPLLPYKVQDWAWGPKLGSDMP